jgi:hypothetical protein|nr:hypothetical protein [uncultured Flavobacterium sp.]
MKKLNILFLSLLTLIAVVSCNKDDDDNSSPAIEGKWQILQQGGTLATLETVDVEGFCNKPITEISQDGLLKSIIFLTVNSTCTPMTLQGTWTKQDSKITFKLLDKTYVYEIVELTVSTLKLKQIEGEAIWYTVYTKK